MSENPEAINLTRDTNSVVSPDNTVITPLETDEKITIRRPANHNEISIIESDWKQISRKINLIKLKKRFDIENLLWGASIPYLLDVIEAWIHSKEPDYLPLLICIILIPVIQKAAKYISFIGEDLTSINEVHLNDIKDIITRIDATSDITDAKASTTSIKGSKK